MDDDKNARPGGEDGASGDEYSEETEDTEIQREFGDDFPAEDKEKTGNKPKQVVLIRLWRGLLRRRVWRKMRRGTIERKDRIAIGLTAGILAATAAQAIIYYAQTGVMQISLFQTQKAIRLAAKNTQIAQETLTEIRKGGTDTHALAVAAKAQADRLKEQLPEIRKSADAAQKSAESSVVDRRPYVVVKLPGRLSPKFAANVEMRATVTVSNIGRTPALKVMDFIGLAYFPQPTSGIPGERVIKSQSDFVDAKFHDLSDAEHEMRSILTPLAAEDDVAPGSEYFSTTNLPTVLTQPQFDGVTKEGFFGDALFQFGLITYTDKDNRPHRTEYCWFLIGKDETNWVRCKFHNIIQ